MTYVSLSPAYPRKIYGVKRVNIVGKGQRYLTVPIVYGCKHNDPDSELH